MNSRQAINLLKDLEQSLDDYCELNDEGKAAFRMAITALELFGNAEQLPSAQPEIRTQMSSANCISRQAALDCVTYDVEYTTERIKALPSLQPTCNQLATDCISRQAAIELAMQYCPDDDGSCSKADRDIRELLDDLENLPSAQPTLYGYNIEHLARIAILLREENLPPERVAEALTDVGRIVSMVRAECEEEFRKAVERCMI